MDDIENWLSGILREEDDSVSVEVEDVMIVDI